MKETQTNHGYKDSVIDFTTEEGERLYAELDETGEVPELLKQRIGEATHVLVALAGNYGWMSMRGGDVGTMVREDPREGEGESPLQRLGLPPAEEVVRRLGAREQGDTRDDAGVNSIEESTAVGGNDHDAEISSTPGVYEATLESEEDLKDSPENEESAADQAERVQMAQELVGILQELDVQGMMEFFGNDQYDISRTVYGMKERVDAIVMAFHRAPSSSKPRDIVTESRVTNARTEINSQYQMLQSREVAESLRAMRVRLEEVSGRISELLNRRSREISDDDIVRHTVTVQSNIEDIQRLVGNIETYAKAIGVIADLDSAYAKFQRVLDETAYDSWGREYYLSALSSIGNEMVASQGWYSRACDNAGTAVGQIQRVIRMYEEK